MTTLARLVVRHRWWVIAAWIVVALCGAFGASRATSALSYDFSLPGQSGYETNADITREFGSGGDNAPVLLVSKAAPGGSVDVESGSRIAEAAASAAPGARIASYTDHPELFSRDRSTAVTLVYPKVIPGADPYVTSLPAMQQVAKESTSTSTTVAVTGVDALNAGGGGGVNVLVETIVGGVGALVVLALVFGSFLAITPLITAAASILTTFLILWGLTSITEVSFIVQYLLALIGLGVAIDYAILIVTRWREARGNGYDGEQAVEQTLATAGRAVLFSGITVAVSLAALIALPVPFLRSIGFTGLLIPLISVVAALTLVPALLSVAGTKLEWPHRRSTSPDSRLWRRVGTVVVRHRWASTAIAIVVLAVLAIPVASLNLSSPTNASLASVGGPAGQAVDAVADAGLGSGLTTPVEIVTDSPQSIVEALRGRPGVAGVVAPTEWQRGSTHIVDAWTTLDSSTPEGGRTAADIREVAEQHGGRVGGISAQNADFIDAVYGNIWWVLLLIVVVTFALLATALRSIVLPLKALVLNTFSLAAAFGVTVFIWQEGHGTSLLFGQDGAGAITIWIPVAVFAFLFGLSMDYEVFLLSRIKEEHDAGVSTDTATIDGVARTGRLMTSAALILFLAFISLAQVPVTDVKILATALALGIILDATIVRGVLAPALVAALGPANWWVPKWWPGRRSRQRVFETSPAS